MHVPTQALAHFTTWLAAHHELAYWVLFLGGYFETLIGTCFFIPGELFLLSGSILAGAHKLSLPLVALALYAGAILGDSSSYFIGRQLKGSLFQNGRRILNPENYQKGERLFEKYGTKAIFFARLLGPLSWITPFLAGLYRVPYKKFLPYNISGIIVGVGEFIVAGYFFGRNTSTFFWIAHRYFFLIVIIAAAIFAQYYVKKQVASNDKPAILQP